MKRNNFKATHRRGPILRIPRMAWMPLVFLLFIVMVLRLVDAGLRPAMTTSATALATRVAVDALNGALTEELAKTVGFPEVIEIERSKDGELRSARFNFAVVTRLQSLATAHAEQNLYKLEEATVRLPLAPAFGDSVLANLAPSIPVRILLIGTVHSSVTPEVKTVGINQTVHILYLDLSANVNVVAPFVSSPTTVHSRIPIAYLVLSGKVPNTVWAPPIAASDAG